MTSRDKFKLASEIRRGEHMDDLPDYDVIVSWLLRCPRTWQGGLLATIAGRIAVEPFFKSDEDMMNFIERAMLNARDQTRCLRSKP